jgi:ubiquinone/menaquinone biosynthesis C-methylase UbiE
MSEHQDTRAAWDRVAPGYDRTNTVTQMWLANEGLRRAGLQRGQKFLDVCSGSGAMAIPAARLGAQVTAVDQSSVMLEHLNARAKKENLSIEARVMDAHSLQFPDNTFDVAGSQFGVMLLPDLPKALREMTRVVKPGGKVLMNVYGDPHQIEFLGVFIQAVQSVRPDFNGPPPDDPPLEFQVADPAKLKSEMTSAGLKNVTVETITESTEFKSSKEMYDWIYWSNPIVDMIMSGMLGISDAEKVTVQQALDKIFKERAGSTGSTKLSNPINIGIGTK